MFLDNSYRSETGKLLQCFEYDNLRTVECRATWPGTYLPECSSLIVIMITTMIITVTPKIMEWFDICKKKIIIKNV